MATNNNIMALSDDVMVLTKEGLTTLAKELLESVNNRIEERIVNVMNDGSDGYHVPSAELVWNSLQGISKLRNVMVKSGDITEANVIKDESTLYVLRKSLTDTSGKAYVWRKDVGFISLGGSISTGGDGSSLNIVAMEKPDIVAAVQAAANQTKPDFGGSTVNPNPPTPTDPDEGDESGDNKDETGEDKKDPDEGGETTPPSTDDNTGSTEGGDNSGTTEPGTTPTPPTVGEVEVTPGEDDW